MNMFFRIVSIVFLYSFMQLAAAVPAVSFVPETQNVNVGDEFSVDIVVSDLPVTEGGGLNLLFDPSVVQVTGVRVEDSVWTFKTHPGDVDNALGKVTDIMFARFDGVSGDAKIVTVKFEGVGSGQLTLAMEKSIPNPFASNGEKLAVQFNKATVNLASNSVTEIVSENVVDVNSASGSQASGSGSLTIPLLVMFILLMTFARYTKLK